MQNLYLSSLRLSPGIIFLFILTLTLITLVVPGYQVLTEDQLLYTPDILQQLDQSLYQNDYFFLAPQTDSTFFDELVATAIKITGLSLTTVYFIFYFLTKFFFFYFIYKLATYLFNQKAGVIALIFFLVPSFVFGTAMRTVELGPHPRMIVITLGLAAIFYLFRKKLLISSILLALTVVLNLPTALIFLISFYLLLFLPNKIQLTKKVLYCLIPILALIILYLTSNSMDSGLLTIMDATWWQIILRRNCCLLISQWSLLDLLAVFTYLIISLIIASQLKIDKKIVFLIIISLVLFCLSFLAGDLLGLVKSLQLQPARGLILLKILSLILFAGYWYQGWQEEKNKKNLFLTNCLGLSLILHQYLVIPWALIFLFTRLKLKKTWLYFLSFLSFLFFVVLMLNSDKFINFNLYLLLVIIITGLLIVIIIAGLLTFFNNFIKLLFKQLAIIVLLISLVFVLFFFVNFHLKSIKQPATVSSEAIELANWLKENTASNISIVTDPDEPFWRVLSQRSIFVNYKDGTQGLFSREFALEWQERMQLLGDLDKIHKNYSVDFLITKKDYPELERIITTGDYKLYQL